MSFIIDRRLNGKNKSMVNRQRFLQRHKKHIKEAVNEAINQRSITDIENKETIGIPNKDTSEPNFKHGQGGDNTYIHPGNKEFVKGDKIRRPPAQGGGGGSGEASDSGEGEDEFVFEISQAEFLEFMFEDLELPNLVKRQLSESNEFQFKHAGFTNVGNPNQINVVRSLRSALARKTALGAKKRRRLKQLKQELSALEAANQEPEQQSQLRSEIDELESKLKRIPFIDEFDLKYNLSVKEPIPSAKAVMFCIMDVSGSMDQATKDTAKRFFILLYLFLQRNYDHTELVFIRHHTSAKEVDEQTFFYSRETGGTIVSSALRLMREIIQERYMSAQWNIYGAQASDGDNWHDDSSNCYQLMTNDILPQVQHYAYVEITPRGAPIAVV